MEAPKPITVNKMPPGEVLSETQWQTLIAIADTVVPSLDDLNQFTTDAKAKAEAEKVFKNIAAKSAPEDIGRKFFAERASDHPRFKELLERQLGLYIPASDLKELSMVLGLLASRPGALILTGRFTPFHQQSLETRQKIMLMWRSSCIPSLRMFYAKMTVLAGKVWLCTSETFTQLTGCPLYPPNGERNPSYKFDFIDFQAEKSEETIDTDVVIIGSGCGGGISAKNLAEAGLKVLVVEKGRYYSTEHFPMTAVDASEALFFNGGAVIADDGSIMTIPGSTWGGGGTVNWSASLHTQDYVREEWAKQGLKFFQSAEYESCLDRVADRMGVSTKHINHNFGNQALVDGGRKLGYECRDIPQNTGNSPHDCGYCTLGCSAAKKQGPAVSFLPDAAKAGAKFIQGFDVSKITFDRTGKKATGLVGTWTNADASIKRSVRINAKTVILSAGTMNSPLILKRSGLKNSHIGRNLHLHPVSFVRARYDQETRPWEGAIMTSLIDFGYCKLEIPSMLPLTVSLMTGWRGGLDYKMNVSSFHHWMATIALTRDRDSGRVYPDAKDGSCRMDYHLSSFDTNNMLEGVIASMKIHYVMGAREIASPNPDIPNWIRDDNEAIPESSSSKPATSNSTKVITNHTSKTTNPKLGASDPSAHEPPFPASFTTFLVRVRSAGINAPYPAITMLSAHQMGTCRMSTSPKTGVVDPDGKVWGVDEGLYVADASVFPSASGVNPMLTTLGIADWVSRGVGRRMMVKV